MHDRDFCLLSYRHQPGAYVRTFFSIPFIIFALLFALPPSRDSDPGYIAGSSPSSPLRFVFITRRFPLVLPSSTRAELCLPTLGALSWAL